MIRGQRLAPLGEHTPIPGASPPRSRSIQMGPVRMRRLARRCRTPAPARRARMRAVLAGGAVRVVMPRGACGNGCLVLILWSRWRCRSVVTLAVPITARAWSCAVARAGSGSEAVAGEVEPGAADAGELTRKRQRPAGWPVSAAMTRSVRRRNFAAAPATSRPSSRAAV